MAFASIGLAACGDDGGGGCPELSGSWSIAGSCVDSTGTTCEVEQDACSVTLSCLDGRTLMGSASKTSISFRDDTVSCSGKLENLEDDDGDGRISPTIDATCTPMGAEMCEIEAYCSSGDCTVPEDEGDEGDSGSGGSSGVFGGGSGGQSGQGGISGTGPSSGDGGSAGVFGGSGGIGGESGTSPAGTGGTAGVFGGSGGVGGSVGAIDAAACASCVDSSCQAELASCTEANGCLPALTCTIGSGCSQDDDECLIAACQGSVTFTPDGETAATDVSICMGQNCLDVCVSSGPVAGTGGGGGIGGEGGGLPPTPGCSDECQYASDNECDDGGDGQLPEDIYCPLGTDCTDCGPR